MWKATLIYTVKNSILSFLRKTIYFIYLYEYVSMCFVYPQNPKDGLGPLELESQLAVSHLKCVLAIKLWSSERQQALLANSLAQSSIYSSLFPQVYLGLLCSFILSAFLCNPQYLNLNVLCFNLNMFCFNFNIHVWLCRINITMILTNSFKEHWMVFHLFRYDVCFTFQCLFHVC